MLLNHNLGPEAKGGEGKLVSRKNQIFY